MNSTFSALLFARRKGWQRRGSSAPHGTNTVGLRTYIVEDNPIIRDNLVGTLEELTCVQPVGIAETEHDGREWLVKNPELWDLAIVDLFLKQGSGLGVIEACRERSSEQAVVASQTHFANALQRNLGMY